MVRKRKSGRRKATGNFKTRETLEFFVWYRWKNTRETVKDIAKEAGVNQMTAHRILKPDQYRQ